MNPAAQLVEVRTRVDDADLAQRIAREVVTRRLAACAHVSALGTSVYWWDGALQADHEHDVTITTTEIRVPEVVAAVEAMHPYELPSIHWQPITATAAYTGWVVASISPTGGS